MANQKTETTPTAGTGGSITKSERSGLLPGVVHLALDVADRGQATAIALLQDVRIELRGAVEGGVELAEKVAAAAFRVARKGIARADDAGAEALAGVGQLLAGAVQSARETTRAAADLATTASSGVTGQAAA